MNLFFSRITSFLIVLSNKHKVICKKCSKIYVGSTITSFRRRFNNHETSVKRYGNKLRGLLGEHLYAHFYEGKLEGIKDMLVKIVDRTDVSDPTKREGFWAYKLDSFLPKGLKLGNFF